MQRRRIRVAHAQAVQRRIVVEPIVELLQQVRAAELDLGDQACEHQQRQTPHDLSAHILLGEGDQLGGRLLEVRVVRRGVFAPAIDEVGGDDAAAGDARQMRDAGK